MSDGCLPGGSSEPRQRGEGTERVVIFGLGLRRQSVAADAHLPDATVRTPNGPRPYSHSIVLGGLLEMSSATRFTPGISLMMRLEIRSSRS